MSKNPFYNAIVAISYIVILISIASTAQGFWGGPKDSILYPMIVLSTLVFSVALMAYLFFYQPVMMFIEGHREKGVKLFFQTLGIFAAAILILLIISRFWFGAV